MCGRSEDYEIERTVAIKEKLNSPLTGLCITREGTTLAWDLLTVLI